ncbi:hypothetical protein D3C81_2267450 [compost metagenome]
MVVGSGETLGSGETVGSGVVVGDAVAEGVGVDAELKKSISVILMSTLAIGLIVTYLAVTAPAPNFRLPS